MVALILIVEDDRANAQLMANLMRTSGFDVAIANEGQQGLHMAYELQPDLMLLDMRLPRLDGWELAYRIRSDPKCRQFPILAVSVPINSGEAQQALAAGCNEYIPKPFNVRYLLDRVRAYLG